MRGNQMLPKDPVLLLSYINTQLRDFYPSLDELAKSLSLNCGEIEETLRGIDYHYDAAQNRFL